MKLMFVEQVNHQVEVEEVGARDGDGGQSPDAPISSGPDVAVPSFEPLRGVGWRLGWVQCEWAHLVTIVSHASVPVSRP